MEETKQITTKTPAKKAEYKSILGLSRWVILLFIVFALLNVLSTLLLNLIIFPQLFNTSYDILTIFGEEAISSVLVAVMFVTQYIIFPASAVVFLFWIYRSNKNITAMGDPLLDISPGWAVGWFFIPIMNYFKPYQAVAEIARASIPNIDQNLDRIQSIPKPIIVKWWWALFIIANYSKATVVRFLLSGGPASNVNSYAFVSLVLDLTYIIGLFVTIFMVRQISQSQEMRFQKLSQVNIPEVIHGQ
jgi:hypothetical protein